MTTLGLIGAGRIGGTLARLAAQQGYDVVVSNSRGPDTLRDLVAEIGSNARAATVEEAADAGDLVVVSVPLHAYTQVPAKPLEGKIVLDTNNYSPERDGHLDALDRGETTSSGLLAAHLPGAKVVKAFNTIRWDELATDGRPEDDKDRRALPIAADDANAKRAVSALLDALGYDAVDAGPLGEGSRFQPGTPAYGARLDAPALRAALDRAA